MTAPAWHPIQQRLRWFALAALVACASPQRAATQTADTRAAVRAAEAAEQARRHDLARARYESAIAGASDRQSMAFARSRFGETLLTWGEYREGAVQLEASVAAYPNDPAPWHNLGLVREQLGNLSGAAEAFERARDLVPTDWRPRISLAELRWHVAAQCFRNPPPHEHCSALVATTQDEYRALLALSIPALLREKVQWALQQLARPNAGLRADVVPAPSS